MICVIIERFIILYVGVIVGFMVIWGINKRLICVENVIKYKYIDLLIFLSLIKYNEY